jgi:peptide/nickel transport system permease protein
MAFPFLLFAIALSSTVGQRLNTITFGFLGQGVFTLVLIFSLFGWFYPARIVRSVTLSLREKEFVESARAAGASNTRILGTEILPNLIGPLIVYSTLLIPTNILFEAALSYLGLGVPADQASWGGILKDASDLYDVAWWLMVFPGGFLILTTLAFNLLGDGLRDAFDVRSER